MEVKKRYCDLIFENLLLPQVNYGCKVNVSVRSVLKRADY